MARRYRETMTKPFVWVFAVFGACCAASALAGKPWWMANSPDNADHFLPPDAAFKVSGAVVDDMLVLRWVIADGYYLYRSKIKVEADSPGLRVGPPELPEGQTKTDEFFGTQEIYLQQATARVPFSREDAGAHPLHFRVTYQGCAEQGLCYQPIVKTLMPQDGPLAHDSPRGASPGVRQSATSQWIWVALGGGLLAFFVAGIAARSRRSHPDR
jgi:thiol:disulfide interchange protein